ncbi:e3 UFM1-protein ligase 1 [Caerostris extrusa]|uniref:E3 UFM1-protein ligase 1 n=1 Tax=Caerostris extrusa TaxID=172846 RepID=A0AAV4VJF4_CAEEX|nr:e3 UFM1-protein ligase 1 [Caerostris extrusa]
MAPIDIIYVNAEEFIKKTIYELNLLKNYKWQILANHRQSLLAQLSEAQDPALGLHLAALLIFQSHTHTMLHASGKFVPHIIGYLQKQLPHEIYLLLATYQESVIKKLTPNENEEEKCANETFLLKTCQRLKRLLSHTEKDLYLNLKINSGF